jgi:2-polyprenyl-3-methyl-5-hydroxy-6-metoxy-1,4-benzoquinol methylase
MPNNLYRKIIYNNYSFIKHDSNHIFDESEAKSWGRPYNYFLKEWIPERKNISILDIGCGWGKLLYFLKTKGYSNLYGVDIVSEQIRIARQIVDNVLEIDAIDYLDNNPNHFDLIIGLDIIEHFKKDEVLSFLEASYRALHPGGRLILQTPNAESPWGLKLRYGDFTHEVAFDPNNLKKLLELYKFEEIETRATEPVIHGIISLCRFLLWKIVWFLLALWNLAETGSIGSGIYTRVFLVSGITKIK